MKKIIALITVLIIALSSGIGVSAAEFNAIIDPETNSAVLVPLGYQFEKTISYINEEIGYIQNPNDIFCDKNGFIYVADTGNNRILKFNENVEFIKEYKMEENKGFNNPQGVFVTDDGTIYVADTDNKRIVLMNQDGTYIREITKPKSEMLGDDFEFTPRKVGVSAIGNVYVIKQQWLMNIDANGEFRGYIGATKVKTSIWYKFKQFFMNETQKMLQSKPTASSCLNFCLGNDGDIYVTTLDEQSQLKQMNALGNNIYPKTSSFGFYGYAEDGSLAPPIFSDVAADGAGNVFLLDSQSSFVYIYDAQGNNLLQFWGNEYGKGQIGVASAIEVDKNRRIMIADTQYNSITVFTPTKFISNVFLASEAYNDGDYDKAMELWKDVAKSDGNYTLANTIIGKAYYKSEEYKDAMKYYKLAEDKYNYSLAMNESRNEFYQKYFILIAAAAVAVVVIIILLVKKYIKFSKKIVERY